MGGRQSVIGYYNNYINQRRFHYTSSSNVNLPTSSTFSSNFCLICQQVIKQEQQQGFLSGSSSFILSCLSTSLCSLGARAQLSNFVLLGEIGQGAFGKVFLIDNKFVCLIFF